jgi:hypothetical protein
MLAAVMILSGCSGSKIKLLEGASPETSAMMLTIYDENTERSYLYDKDEEQKIIDYVNNLSLSEAENPDLESLDGEMYAISIGTNDGGWLSLLWVNDYVVTNDGKFYRSEPDFAKISDSFDMSETDTLSLDLMPNIAFAAKYGGSWNTAFLSPADELSGGDISVEITELSGDTISVRLTNTSDEEGTYGRYFSVQAQIDGIWYNIPTEWDLSFIDLAGILQSGESADMTYDISPYGTLPKGTYRIVVENNAAEFVIE